MNKFYILFISPVLACQKYFGMSVYIIKLIFSPKYYIILRYYENNRLILTKPIFQNTILTNPVLSILILYML